MGDLVFDRVFREITYYALDKNLSEKLHEIAHKRGVSADTLMNLWIHEKLQEQER